MNIQFPVNVSSVTFATAGVKAVTAGVATGVGDVEGTQVCADYSNFKLVNPAAGTVSMAPQITSITVNGNVYAVTDGVSAAMNATDSTALVSQTWMEGGGPKVVSA